MGDWHVGGINLSVKRGNLVDEPAEAIGIGVSANWTPEGAASGTILKAGGNSLVESIQNQDPGQPGDLRQLEGGTLAADTVILCALKDRKEVEDPEAFLRQCVEKLLREADSNQIQSVGLQPIGANDFRYGLDRATRSIVESLEKSAEEFTELSRVSIVVYDAVEFNAVDNLVEETLEGQPTDTGPSPADFT